MLRYMCKKYQPVSTGEVSLVSLDSKRNEPDSSDQRQALREKFTTQFSLTY